MLNHITTMELAHPSTLQPSNTRSMTAISPLVAWFQACLQNTQSEHHWDHQRLRWWNQWWQQHLWQWQNWWQQYHWQSWALHQCPINVTHKPPGPQPLTIPGNITHCPIHTHANDNSATATDVNAWWCWHWQTSSPLWYICTQQPPCPNPQLQPHWLTHTLCSPCHFPQQLPAT